MVVLQRGPVTTPICLGREFSPRDHLFYQRYPFASLSPPNLTSLVLTIPHCMLLLALCARWTACSACSASSPTTRGFPWAL